MIIYGSKGTHLRTEALPGVTCPNCSQPNTLRTSLYSRYAHVYWIPFFPYSKLAAVQCDHCQAGWENRQLPAVAASAVRELKQHTKHPFWTWAGLAVLATAVLLGFMVSTRDHHTDEALLEHPRAGDIYTVRSDSAGMYSLLKVQQVGGNNVQLVANDYQIDNIAPIDKLNSPEKYSKEPFTLTRLELQIMRRKDQITDVDRP